MGLFPFFHAKSFVVYFYQDAGPMAHPVRPHSYIKVRDSCYLSYLEIMMNCTLRYG